MGVKRFVRKVTFQNTVSKSAIFYIIKSEISSIEKIIMDNINDTTEKQNAYVWIF